MHNTRCVVTVFVLVLVLREQLTEKSFEKTNLFAFCVWTRESCFLLNPLLIFCSGATMSKRKPDEIPSDEEREQFKLLAQRFGGWLRSLWLSFFHLCFTLIHSQN